MGFTHFSINSWNHWGQLTDDFFLRRCLLSGKLQSFLCNYSIFVILAACKFYWHLLKGNFFFLALASCLSFFGQTLLALVFRPYFQLFLPMGSFWTRSQVANNVWIVLNHVFRRVTSEYCRCTSVLPLAYLVYHFGTAATAKSLQSCPTLCDPIDGRLPGSSVLGILQARVLECVAIAFSSVHDYWKNHSFD